MGYERIVCLYIIVAQSSAGRFMFSEIVCTIRCMGPKLFVTFDLTLGLRYVFRSLSRYT